MRLKLATLAFAIAIGAASAYGQAGSGGLTQLPAPYYDPDALPLYPGVAPGSEKAKQVEVWMTAPRDLVARNVTKPTITPVLPGKANATGAAVVVVPGGGNVVLTMGKEGYDVAKMLANNGIAAFILKYRVNESPADITKVAPMGAPRGGGAGPGGAPAAGAPAAPPANPPAPGPRYGVVDGKEALRWVRAHAKDYGIDPNRVGMIGFSAGAGNIWGIVGDNDPTAMPNFIGQVYGGFGARPSVPPSPPPLFLAGAADDALMRGGGGFPIVEQWAKAGGKVELHYYQNGAHGFGGVKQGTTSDLSMEEFVLWVRANGFLTPKP